MFILTEAIFVYYGDYVLFKKKAPVCGGRGKATSYRGVRANLIL